MDAYRAQYVASIPVAFAIFMAVTAGLAWTMGSLLVQSLPAARRAFRSIGRSLSGVARDNPAFTKNVVPWLPGSIAAMIATGPGNLSGPSLVPHAVGLTLVILSSWALCRKQAARLATAPAAPEEVDPASAEAKTTTTDSSFAAIAVTRRTKGIVGGSVLATLAMLVAAVTMPTHSLWGPGAVALAAYAVLMLGVAVALRRSRIVVGSDGLLILGADRPRFLAYADHDEVREETGDILLLRRGGVAARLQLDEADRARAPELVERMRVAMGLAERMRSEGADHAARSLVLAEGGSESLAASARGTDYRRPAVIRENLWALVEGPLCDGDTRLLVAEALTKDLRDGEGPRLRVAAKACAEPRVRVALEKLVGDAVGRGEDAAEEDAGAEGVPRQGSRLVVTR